MSEEFEVQADPAARVDRDLAEILRLHEQLLTQAVRDAGHRLMPGGRAMVELGPVANLEAWANLEQATERYGRAYTSVEDEDPDEAWSAFQLLEYWSEQWRAAHGAEYDKKPTIATEANFIRWCLNWAWDNEPNWDDFARDVNGARLKLEDILTDGRRVERSRIVCSECMEAPRLILANAGVRDDRSDEVWKCPNRECRHRYDRDALHRAHARMLHSEKAERWIHQTDAIGLLKSQGRSERTARQWLADGEGDGYCDPVTHEVWCWWPSLWRKHLTTPMRKRKTKTA